MKIVKKACPEQRYYHINSNLSECQKSALMNDSKLWNKTKRKINIFVKRTCWHRSASSSFISSSWCSLLFSKERNKTKQLNMNMNIEYA